MKNIKKRERNIKAGKKKTFLKGEVNKKHNNKKNEQNKKNKRKNKATGQ